MTLRMSRGTATVLFVCAGLLGLNLTAVFITPQAAEMRNAAILSSVAAALLVPLFWLGSARLVALGAGRMDSAPNTRHFRDYSGRTYTILLIYAGLATGAAAAHRWIPASDGVLGILIPILALASLAWFLVAGIRAVRRVYSVPSLNAVTLALLPYAALCALIVAFVLVISVIQTIAG